ncbi:metal-dependent hydrolase [Phosphitispora sp. TUW77]|uniref:metal-dependent hydrolase n=1 Tax=Phosphitispora sp. TUW77 TaxID=3152361 RepID=UPI003AB3B58C
MDLISHGLMGTMMAGLGLNHKFGLAGTVTMIVANIAPDLDVVAGLKGPKTFYKYHREITHSLLGAVVLWALISGGIYFFTPLGSLSAILVMVGAGLAGHLLMDSFTPWGLPLFYPFSSKKYSFDLIWFFDPVIIISMFGSVYLVYHFPGKEMMFSGMGFGMIAAYLILRAIQKRKARRMAAGEVGPRFRDAEVYVLPSAISPFMWDVFYKARSQYLYISVDTRKEEILIVKEFVSASYHRCIRQSCDSELVDVFLKRARFPFYNFNRVDGGYRVEWYDAQLLNLGGVHGVTVYLSEGGTVTAEKLQVKKPVRRRRSRIEAFLQKEAS